jgi:hypothetical protein
MSGIIGGKTRLWLDRVVKTEYPSHSETQFTTPQSVLEASRGSTTKVAAKAENYSRRE